MRELRLERGTARYLKLESDLRVNEDILLVQCESEADAESITKNGAALKSTGGATDAVTLCLSDKTLACKYVETTNVLYLINLEEPQSELENGMRMNCCLDGVHPKQHAGLLSQLKSDAQAEAAPPVMIHAQSHFIVETTHRSIPVQEVRQALKQHCVDRSSVQAHNIGSTGLNWFASLVRSHTAHGIQASDQDIIAALQSIRALCCVTTVGEGWALLQESLLLDALEHVLLTCIEQKLPLDNFDASELLAALKAEDDPLSYAFQHERQALSMNEGCIMWHILRLYGIQILAHAAWDPQAQAVLAERSPPGQSVGFDVQKVARGCLHAVLCRQCQRLQLDPSTGEAILKLADVQEAWRDLFPALHLWHEGSTLCGHDMAAWSNQLMLDACHGLAIPQFRDGSVELRVLFETHLHPTARLRFESLFNVKATWSKDEIEPYLNIHDSECSNPTELLLRYSRVVRDGTDIPPVYCAR